MANKTNSGLTAASLPLDGSEVLYLVQGGNSRRTTPDGVRGRAAGVTAALAQGDLLYVNASKELVRLPKGTAGQVLMQDAGLTAPEWKSFWTELATVATTSGTEKTWTSIPAGVTDIEIWFDGVSKDNVDSFQIQIGTGGSPTNSGYESGSGLAGATVRVEAASGFAIFSNSASDALTGLMKLHRIGGNKWISEHSILGDPATGTSPTGGGRVTLAGTLDNIRLLHLGSTQNFDAGSVQVRYR